MEKNVPPKSIFRENFFSFLPFAAAVSLVAGLGGYWTESTVTTWYLTLHKPLWTPPPAVFGPAWTTLYVLIALAGWRFWRKVPEDEHRAALLFYALQLILNALWPLCFFALKNPGLGVLEIALLWAAILATVLSFWKKDRLAGLLLIPYLAWVSFAAALNTAVWQLNR